MSGGPDVRPSDRQQLAEALCSPGLYLAGPETTRKRVDALLPVVERIAAERAADEIERLADERVWVTEHDNEVVSARDLYEQVARLRGELEPVTYDFPPDDFGAEAITGRQEGQA